MIRLRLAGLVIAAVTVSFLTACRTEYRLPEPDIDGVLWRLVASVEDPLKRSMFEQHATDPRSFIEQLPAVVWDGDDATVPDLSQPAAIVYDVRINETRASFSLFFSSGARPDVPTDSGSPYSGPDSVFTCSDWQVDFASDGTVHLEVGSLGRAWEDCPETLVEAMPGDVAFAEPDVFDG